MLIKVNAIQLRLSAGWKGEGFGQARFVNCSMRTSGQVRIDTNNNQGDDQLCVKPRNRNRAYMPALVTILVSKSRLRNKSQYATGWCGGSGCKWRYIVIEVEFCFLSKLQVIQNIFGREAKQGRNQIMELWVWIQKFSIPEKWRESKRKKLVEDFNNKFHTKFSNILSIRIVVLCFWHEYHAFLFFERDRLEKFRFKNVHVCKKKLNKSTILYHIPKYIKFWKCSHN